MGDGDEVGKIFIGGLTRETTDKMLRDYFEPYGEIIESVVMKEKITQVSRGFGFVKYKDASSVQEVLKNRPHSLDNKKIDPKPCTPRNIQQQKKNAAMEHTQTHKIFIGGLAQNATEEEVKNYFSQYGSVNEVIFVINKEEQRHKGFGFVTFEDEAAVDKAVDKHYHEICGKRVEAKRATPREKMSQGRNPGAPQDGSDGYGGTDYGYGYAQGGWMPPPGNGNANAMMGGFDYGYGSGAGYATSYPQSYSQPSGYYGYNYNPTPAMGVYAQGPNKGDASGYGGMGNYQQQSSGYGGMGNYQQQSSGYGPTRGGQSYGSGGGEYGNGYGRGGDTGSGGSGGRGSGQGYHPYKR